MTSAELLARLTADMAELQTLREALAVAAPGLSAPEALAQLLARAEPERHASAGAETVRPPAPEGKRLCLDCKYGVLSSRQQPCYDCLEEGLDGSRPRP